jgi:hypothetical protein
MEWPCWESEREHTDRTRADAEVLGKPRPHSIADTAGRGQAAWVELKHRWEHAPVWVRVPTSLSVT